MQHWTKKAVFYHIYPLGFCGASAENTPSEPVERLDQLLDWIPYWKKLGVNAIYLGPIFASSRHGYDTSDYYQIDPRLGTRERFSQICGVLHQQGFRIILDGVFNHVGRNFWAFQDVQQNKEASPYCSWFENLNFNGDSPYGDPFWYEGWEGHYDLVKLNLSHPDVVEHLLGAVNMWIDEFQIDGLRLDAANHVRLDFWRQLRDMTKQKKPDFWLMGEIIHGDYNIWANSSHLDSVTNYECYKGIYSSHNDHNYFEIAHSLNRQFAEGGIYRTIDTYNFLDNHDVNRIASTLHNPNHIFNAYTILFTMPGIPSIYYGSEFALPGKKEHGSDQTLRPSLSPSDAADRYPDLQRHISTLSIIRKTFPAIQEGAYQSVVIRNEQLLYRRFTDKQTVYVALNLSDSAASFDFSIGSSHLWEAFSEETLPACQGQISITVPPCSAKILLETNGEPVSLSPQSQPVALQEESAHTPSSSQQEESTGWYQDRNGYRYHLVAFASDAQTGEPLVVYHLEEETEHLLVLPKNAFFEALSETEIE